MPDSRLSSFPSAIKPSISPRLLDSSYSNLLLLPVGICSLRLLSYHQKYFWQLSLMFSVISSMLSWCQPLPAAPEPYLETIFFTAIVALADTIHIGIIIGNSFFDEFLIFLPFVSLVYWAAFLPRYFARGDEWSASPSRPRHAAAWLKEVSFGKALDMLKFAPTSIVIYFGEFKNAQLSFGLFHWFGPYFSLFVFSLNHIWR